MSTTILPIMNPSKGGGTEGVTATDVNTGSTHEVDARSGLAEAISTCHFNMTSIRILLAEYMNISYENQKKKTHSKDVEVLEQ